ncbi:zinc-ribbon domain-containing protein [Methanobrevibacter sp.]|uniref:zinc ribbon domain-containing protein n=1 Tax=Methanobrevibacter sp. TaxID=66852 RepID=UPI00388D2FEA
MRCSKCGFENNDKAKFCTKCGNSLNDVVVESSGSNNTKYIIIALLAVIVILAGTIGFLALNGTFDNTQSDDNSQQAADSQPESSVESSEEAPAQSSSSSQVSTSSVSSQSKSWVSIGKYSGSGSGSETISVPDGDIMVKLSAYPIKNYATNHLYVSGSNGASGGVDWGSKSAVETRSDSFTYSSSSYETFTIDYYETVNWEVEFFRYQ